FGRVDDRGVLVLVVELVEEVPHRVQPGSLLVIALDRDPRGVVGVRAAEGLLLGLRVVLPPFERFEVHRRQLPPPHPIDLTDREPRALLALGHREPELRDMYPGVYEQLLDHGTWLHQRL